MSEPWYQSTRRWSQTNLTEIDAKECNLDTWRKYWRENRIQGVIVNAGGIVAYYPSEDPLQYRSAYLGERDLFQEFLTAAQEMNLAVLARMDINRVNQAFYDAHPDWVAVDSDGQPYRASDRYIACINGEYVRKYVPQRLQEIARRYAPDGFTDNSWQGPSAKQICHCAVCKAKFLKDTGLALPVRPDWNDQTYRRWVRWSIQCRMDNWKLLNDVTRSYSQTCLWLGMVNADPVNSHGTLYDLALLGKNTPILMTDHQSRDDLNGFEQNLCNGLLLHGIAGAQAILPESMARYVRGKYTFRRSATPMLEIQLWMLTGMAGGIAPWLHIVGGEQADQRLLHSTADLMQWHQENEQYLFSRTPVANVGLVWSQQNSVFYGRDEQHQKCALPWRGFTRALTQARIPYLPICAEDIPDHHGSIQLLILPNIAVLTDAQIDQLERYVKSGGNVLLTGSTGMLDDLGNLRKDHRVDQLFGIERSALLRDEVYVANWEQFQFHNYMQIRDPGHPILKCFEHSSQIPFGGQYQAIDDYAPAYHVLTTLINAYPIYPPEFSYQRDEATNIPLLLAGENEYGGRVVILAADIDKRLGEAALPDHADLLIGAIQWLTNDTAPFTIDGPGYLATMLYAQDDRYLLHIINLSGANASPGFAQECYPVGPIKVSLHCTADEENWSARGLVRKHALETSKTMRGICVSIDSLTMHELIVFEQNP